MPLRLSGTQIGILSALLKGAFLRHRFDEFLFYRLNKTSGDYTAPNDDDQAYFFKILKEANAQGWLLELLLQARNAVPNDEGLLKFASAFNLSARTFVRDQNTMVQVTGSELELKIKRLHSTVDIRVWRKRLGDLEGRICRIEYPEFKDQGTGFLISPNVVMTNYHVVKAIHELTIDHRQVVLRFDYKVLDDGVTVYKGTPYHLATDWLIDHSPPSPVDEEIDPVREPTIDELDYALLRVNDEPGNDPVGGPTQDPRPTPRGWIDLPSTYQDFTPNSALYILEHPDGKPMQVAIDSDAIISVNGNGTRVRYTTMTEPGASGSPCFNFNWEWVALHHSGDPKYWRGMKPQYNEGIPVKAIRDRLKSKQMDGVFGNQI